MILLLCFPIVHRAGRRRRQNRLKCMYYGAAVISTVGTQFLLDQTFITHSDHLRNERLFCSCQHSRQVLDHTCVVGVIYKVLVSNMSMRGPPGIPRFRSLQVSKNQHQMAVYANPRLRGMTYRRDDTTGNAGSPCTMASIYRITLRSIQLTREQRQGVCVLYSVHIS